MNLFHRALVSITLITFIQACGGGTSKNVDNQEENTPFKVLIIEADFNLGKSIELILLSPTSQVSNIKWTQVSGTPIEFVASTHKVVSITPTSAGNYSFRVSFTANDNQEQITTSFEIIDEQGHFTVPNGHMVQSGNNVSLRAFSYQNQIDSIKWRETTNLGIVLEEDDSELLLFSAPETDNQDLIATFEVTAKIEGNTYQDTVSILIEAAQTIANNAYFDERVATVYPYNENSPYANDIVKCVYSNTLSSSCKLATLPIIAQDTLTPTIEDIMNRVVVSHSWMGDNFKAFLSNLDQHDDFKQLLRATTAIVISSDIRPSFYWAATGAIYLDPNYLWLTPIERDSINEAPDYRSAFGKELRFSIPWRYVKENRYAFNYYDITRRLSRPLSSLTYPLGFLLYHELAHANDYFPKQLWGTLDSENRLLDAALAQSPISDLMTVRYPLNSQILKSLARVRFAGETATELEKSYTPQEISTLFEPDGAVHFYGFNTEREDFAMLFEELMMQHRYGIYRDVAVTNNPSHDEDTSNNYIVDWGQRGRLAEPQIRERMRYVTSNVLPEFDVDNAISLLPNSIEMTHGKSWHENLMLNGANKRTLGYSQPKALSQNQPYQYYTKPLPRKEP